MNILPRGKKLLAAAAVLILIAAVLLTVYLYPAKPDDGYRLVIGISQFSVETVHQNAFKRDASEAAARYDDVNVLFMNAGASAEKQSVHIGTLLQQNIDALIVDAPDYAPLEPALQNARGMGVPVVLLGSPETREECDMLLVADYFAMGKAAGEYMLTLDPVPVNMLEVQGEPRSSKAMKLQSGFRSAVEDSGSRLSFVIAGYDSSIIAEQRATDSGMAEKSPSVDGLFVHSEEMVFGVTRALADIPIVAVGTVGQDGPVNPKSAIVSPSSGRDEAVEFAVRLLEPNPELPKSYKLPVELILPAKEEQQ